MGTYTQPLAYLDFADANDDEMGRVLIIPQAGVAEELIGLFRAAGVQNSAASFIGASVLCVRPHSFLSIGKSTGGTVVGSSKSCALPPGAGLDWDCVVVFRAAEATSAGIELAFSGRACACLQSEGWRSAGRVFRGFDVVQQLAAWAGRKAGIRFVVTECGVVEAGQRLGGENCVDQDVYPDATGDATLSFCDIEAVTAAAAAIKASGSLLFRMERYEAALWRYAKALRYLNEAAETRALGREAQGRLVALSVPCILASATCKLRTRDFQGALDDCNEALELAPSNPKVFYRRGQAQHGKLQYEAALFDLYRALKLNPNDKAVKGEIAAVEGALAVTKSKSSRDIPNPQQQHS